jgi:acetoin utilization protein AcuB
MRVQEVMTKDVLTISPAKAAEHAWGLMQARRIHHLVVTDGPKVVGVLSDRDVGGRNGASLRRDHTVGELMTDRVVTVSPQATVREAANLMRGRSIGCLVVASANRPVGIVTVADLLTLIGRGAERPMATAQRRIINHRAPHRKRNRATGVW